MTPRGSARRPEFPPRTHPRYTVVSFHAHPDDEALLTSGTLARAVAEGHRVVLVVATDGEAGLAGDGVTGVRLGAARRGEVEASAAAIGADAVHFLGYGDSGFEPDPEQPLTRRTAAQPFSATPVEEAAARLADLLRAEHADVLTSYDEHGGYGHPDHVQVHRVGRRAAALAGTPVVLEATTDRDLLLRAVRSLRRVTAVLPVASVPSMPDLSEAFLARSELTHRVDVRGHLGAKLGALRAHGSQAEGGSTIRTVALLVRLPRPLRRRVLGTEWFREVGRAPGEPLLDNIFASLETHPGEVQELSATLGS